MTNFKKLNQVGYTVRCCLLCEHSRFYPCGASVGLCTKYKLDDDTPISIHKLGRCARGFKPHADTVTKHVTAHREFATPARRSNAR